MVLFYLFDIIEILQKIDLPKALYLGGLLMHENGHVYGVHANILVNLNLL
jgi:hypothetical protein